MTAKRKPTYEQDLALARGRQTARTNQRGRTYAREQREAEDAARRETAANHQHRWHAWQYADDYTAEERACECGATEKRKLRPL